MWLHGNPVHHHPAAHPQPGPQVARWLALTAPSRQPPLRDFADRGTAWLLESPSNLRDLVGLIEAQLAAKLDFSRATPDNRPLLGDDLDKRQNDVLFRVPFKDDTSEAWVCVLLEHQSEPDPLLGFRLLRYMVGVWNLQLRTKRRRKRARLRGRLTPIIPIVFYTGRRPWSTSLSLEAAMDLPQALARFVPRHDTLFLDLKETSSNDLVGSAMASVLRVMKAERAPLGKLVRVPASAIEALDNLPEEMGAERREAFHYLLLLVLHRRAAEEQERLIGTLTTAARKHREEVEQMKKMFAIETWLQESRKEGEQNSLLRLLQLRFGPLPQHVPSKIEALTATELEATFDKAVTASSLAELHLDD